MESAGKGKHPQAIFLWPGHARAMADEYADWLAALQATCTHDAWSRPEALDHC